MKKQTLLLFLILFCGLQLFPQKQDTIVTDCDFAYSNQFDSLLQFRNLLGNLYRPLTTAEDTVSVKSIVDNCSVYDSFLVKAKEIEGYRPYINKYGFSSNAKIIEVRQIQNYGIKNRAIVYWIEFPHVNIYCEDDYDCSSSMTGHGTFVGKIRFSLVNTENSRIINTINYNYLETNSDEKGNWYNTIYECNSLPFSSPSKSSVLAFGERSYFTAIGGDSIKEGLTEIIHLDDFNGDGLNLEFPIFVPSGGCMGYESTLFGYSII